MKFIRSQVSHFDFNVEEDKATAISTRLQALEDLFTRPQSVEMWRKSVLSWTDIEVQRQVRWTMCARRMLSVVGVEEDNSRKDLLAFAEQSFWHPVAVSRDNQEEPMSDSSRSEAVE